MGERTGNYSSLSGCGPAVMINISSSPPVRPPEIISHSPRNLLPKSCALTLRVQADEDICAHEKVSPALEGSRAAPLVADDDLKKRGHLTRTGFKPVGARGHGLRMEKHAFRVKPPITKLVEPKFGHTVQKQTQEGEKRRSSQSCNSREDAN